VEWVIGLRKKYEFLEGYTADVAFIAYGDTIDEVFANAAEALTEIQTDVSKVDPAECINVTVEGYDMENLLKRWLEELLYYRDVRGMFFSRFEVTIREIEQEGEKILQLSGRICGEKFDPDKHTSKVEVKAISYHDMRVGKKDNIFFARVLVDI